MALRGGSHTAHIMSKQMCFSLTAKQGYQRHATIDNITAKYSC